MKTAAPVKTSKLLTVLLALTTAVALLTGSIAVPILYRPFYYLQIGPLELEERTGLSEEEIGRLVVLDVREQAFFTENGFADQHAGGQAFAHQAEVMAGCLENTDGRVEEGFS